MLCDGIKEKIVEIISALVKLLNIVTYVGKVGFGITLSGKDRGDRAFYS